MQGTADDRTRIGLSYSKYLTTLGEAELRSFDYIEVPFELLDFDPGVLPLISSKPLLLHCASLSLGGYTPPGDGVRQRIREYVQKTHTPWIGEHLSYILADKLDDRHYEPYSDESYNIGYTVNPVMNSTSVDNIIRNLEMQEAYFGVPIIVENSPLYFRLPASEMSQVEFINAICANSAARLLLDLTHFYISSQNFSYDAQTEIRKLPLERVREIHISGVAISEGTCWDNHASHAPPVIFDLLRTVMERVQPEAITFEYNWSPEIAWDRMEREFDQVREILMHA